MDNQVRVRIAPSPTGLLHLGTARAALFNYLYAKNNKGKFILRIEDTDLERSNIKYENDILEGLSWLNIKWDEGPIKDSNKYLGDFGPYRQSERAETYKKYINKLLDEGKAYHCFCTKEELEEDRKNALKSNKAPIYSGKCKNLSKEEAEKLKKEGKKSIIRFKVPEKIITFNDIIRGKLKFDTKLIGDISIAKNTNTPLYNLAVVVDDFSMEINNVIRGEDHISNTPKQILLQEALGFPTPHYAHLPLILGPDKSKLSKRHGATSVIEYKKEGYLPEAMINFMALLGWNPKDEREIFSLEELENEFDIKNVGKSGAIFNMDRLDYINGIYIRNMDLKDLTNKCIPYLEKDNIIEQKEENQWKIIKTGESATKEWLEKIISLEQERIKKLSDITSLTKFIFKSDLEYEPELLIWKKSSKEETKDNLNILHDFLGNLTPENYTEKELEKIIFNLLKEKNIKPGNMLWPMRVALSGEKASPGPFELAAVLNKQKTLKRIESAIKKLN